MSNWFPNISKYIQVNRAFFKFEISSTLNFSFFEMIITRSFNFDTYTLYILITHVIFPLYQLSICDRKLSGMNSTPLAISHVIEVFEF